jgi:hypothetical protein
VIGDDATLTATIQHRMNGDAPVGFLPRNNDDTRNIVPFRNPAIWR